MAHVLVATPDKQGAVALPVAQSQVSIQHAMGFAMIAVQHLLGHLLQFFLIFEDVAGTTDGLWPHHLAKQRV